MDRTAEEILDDLLELGTLPTGPEVVALCAELAGAMEAEARLAALEHAMTRAGWSIVDMTTDDDDEQVLELVPPDPEDGE